MSTKSTTRRPGAKPRSVGILALVASMSLVFAGLVGLGLASPAAADDTVSVETNNNNHGGGHTPVTICHKGNTITVDDDAVPAHLREHGDTVGPCQETDPCVSADSQRNNDNCEDPDPCKDNVSPSTNGGQGDQHCDEPGPQGPKGDTGPQGPKGDTGPQGPKGDTGPKGPAWDECESVDVQTRTFGGSDDHGKTGPKGDTGPVGPKGDTGPQGECGDPTPTICGVDDTEQSQPSVRTSDGDKGPQGPKGPTGDQGPKGPTGDQGPKGPTGDQGPQGDSRPCDPPVIPETPGTPTVADCNDTGSCGQTCEQLGNCQKSVPVTAAASATVLAPAAATVAVPAPAKAPAKKPVKVPAPGSVSAGVAGSGAGAGVSAPAAATVPSAVPAGDGSQAPVLPMWALALIAVGVIGAAAAGKQLMGSKN